MKSMFSKFIIIIIGFNYAIIVDAINANFQVY